MWLPGGEFCSFLREIDPETGATIRSLEITLAGETIVGATGLATDPTDQTLYALLRLEGEAQETPKERELVTINPTTGEATSIGSTGDTFADLAFDAEGNLYGVTGRVSVQMPPLPQTFFTLDKNDATPTEFLLDTGSGFFGGGAEQTLAFNPDDGLMYHAAGFRAANIMFESIDLTTGARSDIPLSAEPYYGGATGMTYRGSGVFLVASLEEGSPVGAISTVTTGGVVTLIGFPSNNDTFMTGLAFVRFDVGGTVAGINPTNVRVTCQNQATKQEVRFVLRPDVTAWDCEAEGLEVMSGDRINMEMTAKGIAD